MKTRGFTLIEILIVLLIISIVASVASLSIHFNRKKQMEMLATQIAHVIQLAQNDSLLRSQVLGIALTNHSLKFFNYDEKNQKWILTPEKVFHEKIFSDGLMMTLKIQHKTIPIDAEPHLIISANGDFPNFEMDVGEKNQPATYKVIGKESGEVYVTPI